MNEPRPIETKSFAKLNVPATFGKLPKLEWLSISALCVDPEYQREISNVGRKNIRRIAENFNWSMFGTVMVAAIGSSRYAIVDGQHRTTAAALCGIEKVPCQIVEALRGEQAAAFRAINGNTTRPHTLQLFHAAVAAGEPEALRIASLCKAAGLTVLKGPVQFELLKPGQLSFVSALGKVASRYGEDVTIKALRAVVAAGAIMTSVIAVGVVEVLNDHPEWTRNEKALQSAFETIDLDEMLRVARSKAAHLRGSSATEQFESLLVDALTRVFGASHGKEGGKAEKEKTPAAQPATASAPAKQVFGQRLTIGRDFVVFRGKRIKVSPRAAILLTVLANARPNCVGDVFLIAKMWTTRPPNADELLESIIVDLASLKQIGLEVRSLRGVGRQLVERPA